MKNPSTAGRRRWLSLSAASRILEVNAATLRDWADSGFLRVFRTPGGHRRFLSEDVYGLLGQGQARPETRRRHEEIILRRIRRHLHTGRASRQPWLQDIEVDGRSRMRFLGRRLLSLFTQFSTGKGRKQELLAEARLLGESYGEEMVRRRLPLSEAMEAFIFFRNSILDATTNPLWPQLVPLADQVLLGITHVYEQEPPVDGYSRRISTARREAT
ncbi:MAG: MerR family transcriptional regulator [Dehalococcoidia bacterium]